MWVKIKDWNTWGGSWGRGGARGEDSSSSSSSNNNNNNSKGSPEWKPSPQTKLIASASTKVLPQKHLIHQIKIVIFSTFSDMPLLSSTTISNRVLYSASPTVASALAIPEDAVDHHNSNSSSSSNMIVTTRTPNMVGLVSSLPPPMMLPPPPPQLNNNNNNNYALTNVSPWLAGRNSNNRSSSSNSNKLVNSNASFKPSIKESDFLGRCTLYSYYNVYRVFKWCFGNVLLLLHISVSVVVCFCFYCYCCCCCCRCCCCCCSYYCCYCCSYILL